jgi:hypothetical protein
MAQSANAMHCDDISSARAGITQRVEDCNSGAHQRRRLVGGHFLRNRSQRIRRRNQVLCISTVEINASDFSIDAHREVTTTTLFADEAMSTMPTDTDALTFGPRSNVVANRIDVSCNFMTWHTWILKPGPKPFFNKSIAVANATCLNFNADLSSAWFRDVALHQFPLSTGPAYLCDFHFCIHDRSLLNVLCFSVLHRFASKVTI